MQRFALCLVLLALPLVQALAQSRVALEFAKSNRVYRGVPIEVTILASDLPCDRLKVTAPNGRIERIGSCRYRYTADSVTIVDPISGEGMPRINVYRDRIHSSTLLESKELIPRDIEYPRPHVTIGGGTRDSISIAALKSQRGIYVYLPGYDFELTQNAVTSFELVMLHDENWIRFLSRSPYFSPEMASAFDTLRPGNRIFITDVMYRQPDGSITELDTIDFYLKP